MSQFHKSHHLFFYYTGRLIGASVNVEWSNQRNPINAKKIKKNLPTLPNKFFKKILFEPLNRKWFCGHAVPGPSQGDKQTQGHHNL